MCIRDVKLSNEIDEIYGAGDSEFDFRDNYKEHDDRITSKVLTNIR